MRSDKVLNILRYSKLDDMWYDVNYEIVETLLQEFSDLDWGNLINHIQENSPDANSCLMDALCSLDPSFYRNKAILALLIRSTKINFMAYLSIMREYVSTFDQKIILEIINKSILFLRE